MRSRDWSSDVCSSDLGNQPSVASAALLRRPQNRTIPFKTAGAACETDEGAFGNGPCPPRILRNQGRYDFPVPCFAMLDVKHGMQIEIASLAIAQADAAQPFCDHRGSPWRRHFAHEIGRASCRERVCKHV